MLFHLHHLDEQERNACDRLERLQQALDGGAVAEWLAPLWSGRLWRLMFAQATMPTSSALASDSSVRAIDAASHACAADAGYRAAKALALSLARDRTFRYSIDTIKQLHRALAAHVPDADPGCLRQGPVWFRQDQTGERRYAAPAADQVPVLLDELFDELNTPAPVSAPTPQPQPPIVTAALVYINFILIHPFVDGNGRTARCLHTLVLARAGYRSPAFCSLDDYLGRGTQEHNDLLLSVTGSDWQPARDPRPWVRTCIRGHLWQAAAAKHRLTQLDAIAGEIERALSAGGGRLGAMPLLLDAALGAIVRPPDVTDVRDVSRLLAGRALAPALACGLLVKADAGSDAAYAASPDLKATVRQIMGRPLVFDEPFPATPAEAGEAAGAPAASLSSFWKNA